MSTKQGGVTVSVERAALRKRIYAFYRYLNKEAFSKCYSFLHPSLRQKGRVDESTFIKSLSDFHTYYGTVQLVVTKIELYLGVKTKVGLQDFGYPLIVWKDSGHLAHLFRQRWVKQDTIWFTGIAGLVTPDINGAQDDEDNGKNGTHS